MTDDPRPRCARCNLIVDPMGTNDLANPTYCRCICHFPEGGCLQPIYFIINANGNRQPFDYDGVPHHATCAALTRWKALAKKQQRPPGVPDLFTFR